MDILKAPPHSFESESAVIGAMIVKPELIPEIRKILVPEDFYMVSMKTIYRSILNLADAGRSIDIVLVKDELTASGDLEKIGGVEKLAATVETYPVVWNAVEYARNIRTFSLRRKLISLSLQAAKQTEQGQSLNGELDEIIRLSKSIDNPIEREPKSIQEIRREMLELGQLETIPSSFPGLDQHITGGYKPRQFIIIGAFTGGGKTTSLLREAVDKAKAGHPVLYVSCELAAVEILKKIDLATRAGEDISDEIPLKIEDRIVDFQEIAFSITRWTEQSRQEIKTKTPLVVLDYIQRVRGSSDNGREREVGQVAEDLQTLAKLLNVVILCAAQLNRESQKENEPQLHHMRESGLIEQTGDVVLLVSKVGDDRMRVVLAKNRWGVSGIPLDITVNFLTGQFTETDETKYWIPLASRIMDRITSAGGKISLRDLRNSIGWGGSGKHPSEADILNAEQHTKSFKVVKKDAMFLNYGNETKNDSDASSNKTTVTT